MIQTLLLTPDSVKTSDQRQEEPVKIATPPAAIS
jgi:hypothetical protein